MDTNLPTAPVEVISEGSSFLKRNFIAFLIFSMAIILLAAYSPQILTKLGLRPKEPVELIYAEPVIPRKDFPAKMQSGPFACPTVAEFCTRDGKYTGGMLSGTLQGGSPLLAAFDGTAQGLPSFPPKSDGSKGEYTLVLLLNKERGLTARYYFKGTGIAFENVRAGDAIGQTNGQTLSFMGNNSFVFKLSKVTAMGQEEVALSAKDFKP